jgi:hypothetical protein
MSAHMPASTLLADSLGLAAASTRAAARPGSSPPPLPPPDLNAAARTGARRRAEQALASFASTVAIEDLELGWRKVAAGSGYFFCRIRLSGVRFRQITVEAEDDDLDEAADWAIERARRIIERLSPVL